MIKKRWNAKFKTILAIVWFVFTFSLVGWWLIYSLNRTDLSPVAHRMFQWEGSILLAAVLIGGGTMIFLTYRDEKRHERLKFFFSTFSHDIKTSISRLRLQAEVLEENFEQVTNPVFQRLIQDINRLDLQLENSLLLSNLEESPLFIEEMSLSQIIQLLRADFSDLKIELTRDARVQADKRAFISVIRNLLQNSVVHGKAEAVQIQPRLDKNTLVILIQDNGSGFSGDLKKLGEEILSSQDLRGNGIGLLLSRRLMQKMKGELEFSSDQKGFRASLRTPGGFA